MEFGLKFGFASTLPWYRSPSLSPALWLDASDLSTITESGGAVSQWGDKSGNGNHATQGTGALQPTTGTHSVNGRNVLYFSGDTLVLPSALYTVPNGGNTMFIVGARDAETGSYETFISMTESGSSRFAMRCTSTSGIVNYVSGTSSSGPQVSGNNNTVPAIMAGRRSGADRALYVNGGAPATDTDGADESGVNAAEIGSQPGTIYNSLTGVTGEIIIFDRALNTAEMNKTGQYLAAKWGITWTSI